MPYCGKGTVSAGEVYPLSVAESSDVRSCTFVKMTQTGVAEALTTLNAQPVATALYSGPSPSYVACSAGGERGILVAYKDELAADRMAIKVRMLTRDKDQLILNDDQTAPIPFPSSPATSWMKLLSHNNKFSILFYREAMVGCLSASVISISPDLSFTIKQPVQLIVDCIDYDVCSLGNGKYMIVYQNPVKNIGKHTIISVDDSGDIQLLDGSSERDFSDYQIGNVMVAKREGANRVMVAFSSAEHERDLCVKIIEFSKDYLFSRASETQLFCGPLTVDMSITGSFLVPFAGSGFALGFNRVDNYQSEPICNTSIMIFENNDVKWAQIDPVHTTEFFPFNYTKEKIQFVPVTSTCGVYFYKLAETSEYCIARYEYDIENGFATVEQNLMKPWDCSWQVAALLNNGNIGFACKQGASDVGLFIQEVDVILDQPKNIVGISRDISSYPQAVKVDTSHVLSGFNNLVPNRKYSVDHRGKLIAAGDGQSIGLAVGTDKLLFTPYTGE